MSSMNWIFKTKLLMFASMGYIIVVRWQKSTRVVLTFFERVNRQPWLVNRYYLERLNDLSVNYWSQHLPCISTLPTVMLDRALSSCELKKFCANVSSYAICFSLTHPQTSLHLSKLFTTNFFFNKPAIKVLSRVLFRFLTKIWIKV